MSLSIVIYRILQETFNSAAKYNKTEYFFL